VAFNVHRRGGEVVDHREVEELAARRRISLRTGCFCNPGAGEAALHLGRRRLAACFAAGTGGMTGEDFRHCVGGSEGAGAVRVSLGLWSDLDDLAAFLELAESFVER
jgi:selenocysteine lyase/cysteine desulfurase